MHIKIYFFRFTLWWTVLLLTLFDFFAHECVCFNHLFQNKIAILDNARKEYCLKLLATISQQQCISITIPWFYCIFRLSGFVIFTRLENVYWYNSNFKLYLPFEYLFFTYWLFRYSLFGEHIQISNTFGFLFSTEFLHIQTRWNWFCAWGRDYQIFPV